QALDFLRHGQPHVRDLGPVKVQRQQVLEVLEFLEPLVPPHRIVFPAELGKRATGAGTLSRAPASYPQRRRFIRRNCVPEFAARAALPTSGILSHPALRGKQQASASGLETGALGRVAAGPRRGAGGGPLARRAPAALSQVGPTWKCCGRRG